MLSCRDIHARPCELLDASRNVAADAARRADRCAPATRRLQPAATTRRTAPARRGAPAAGRNDHRAMDPTDRIRSREIGRTVVHDRALATARCPAGSRARAPASACDGDAMRRDAGIVASCVLRSSGASFHARSGVKSAASGSNAYATAAAFAHACRAARSTPRVVVKHATRFAWNCLACALQKSRSARPAPHATGRRRALQARAGHFPSSLGARTCHAVTRAVTPTSSVARPSTSRTVTKRAACRAPKRSAAPGRR